jgi:hypothetical protein
MAPNDVLLERQNGKPSGLLHKGQIIKIRSDLRCTSEGFEIPGCNAKVALVTFALETCDRGAMAWQATTAALSGELIRYRMMESIECRFDDVVHALHPIEWLNQDGCG